MGDSSALVTAAGIDINTGISAMALRNSTLARNAIEDASEHPGGRGGRKGSQQPGKLYAFGSGDYGRLGHGDNQPKKTAKLIDILRDKNIIKFSCGPRHTLALAGDGTVWSWGYGGDGQLGHGDYQLQTMPVQIKALTGEHVIDLATGDKHSAALTSGGDVFTWGDGSLGQLGQGDFRKQHTPHRVMELQGKMILQISCGGARRMRPFARAMHMPAHARTPRTTPPHHPDASCFAHGSVPHVVHRQWRAGIHVGAGRLRAVGPRLGARPRGADCGRVAARQGHPRRALLPRAHDRLDAPARGVAG